MIAFEFKFSIDGRSERQRKCECAAFLCRLENPENSLKAKAMLAGSPSIRAAAPILEHFSSACKICKAAKAMHQTK
jgi:hypothetical protein